MRNLILAFCLVASGTFAADLQSVKHVPNFDKVDEHLYRGGQPSMVGIEELGAFGIKRVIDLREKGEAETSEEKALAQLGIKYVNVPLPPLSAPNREQVNSVLALLSDNGAAPVFLHCRRGKDRTGTVIACYRIQHDGWSNQRALAEARDYGMSSVERGMRAFVLRFTAAATGTSPLATQPRVQ